MNPWANRLFLAMMRGVLRVLFRWSAVNARAARAPGPLLLVPNHLSWIDWLFVGLALEPDWKFVASSLPARVSRLHAWILSNPRIILIDEGSPYAAKHMAEHLEAGGKLVLFAEGRMSRTGTLQRLFDGTGFLLHKTGARVIFCHLRGAQRVARSPHAGWTKWFPKVTTHFSDPTAPPAYPGIDSGEARGRLTQWARDRMVSQQFEVEMEHGPVTLLKAVAQMARQQPRHVVLEDTSGRVLTYRELMMGADLLSRQWKSLPVSEGGRVGVLLPNANVHAATLCSLWAAGRVPALLNYSAGTAAMLQCAQIAGLRHIITSRSFVEKAKLDLALLVKSGITLVFIEDIRDGISASARLLCALRHRCCAWEGPCPPSADTAVVLFTSGSEGQPKAVELTHRNLLANVRQCAAVIDLQDRDRVFTCLPLFHSFGLTVGLLLPLVRGMYAYLFPSPLSYRQIPAAFYDRDCTVLLGTNTFVTGYARAAHPADFARLRYLICGAEKVQEATRELWAREFGVRIHEGYGATETSPVASVNTVIESRAGSVGRLFPAMDYRIEPVDGVAEGGRLFLRGPNIMKGYLNPDAHAAFAALGGWYDTGDIAHVDADRFIYIRGRAKRFAKVGGEMVSLTAVEDALAGAFPQFGEHCQIAVLSRSDAEKGESLVAITNEARLDVGELRRVLQAKGLPNFAVPREVRVVSEIPVLGSGKINHRELEKALG